MKNLKTNTQPSARNLFTSCLCGLSSAVLASSFALFAPAPEAAVAATLIDSDKDGIIEGVNDLKVGDSYYDVEFVNDSGASVYSDGFGDPGFDSVRATEALIDILNSELNGTEARFEDTDSLFRDISDKISIGYQDIEQYGLGGLRFVNIEQNYSIQNLDLADDDSEIDYEIIYDGVKMGDISWVVEDQIILWARFSAADPADPSPASTPEPSLILGFITLGGLMLGSKRKTKG